MNNGKWYGTNATYNKTDDYRYGFNGMEKEKNMDASGDITDFGARVYEDGRFLSPDPQSYNFPYISVYAFGNNNPIASIDPDGEATLFINGWFKSGTKGVYGEGDGGKADYWGGFDNMFMAATGDNNAFYIDGSMDGTGNTLFTTLIGLENSNNLRSEVRRDAGYEWALTHGEDIIKSLEVGESINLVGHSMGVGFGRGVIAGLIMLANKMGKKLIFETLLDIETFQAVKFPVPTKTMNWKNEPIFENNLSKVAGDNGSYLPSVKHTEGSEPAGFYPNASHGIADYDAEGIGPTKYAPSIPNKTEYGNNNKGVKKSDDKNHKK